MKSLITAYQFEFMSLDNEPIKLTDYEGKVLLIVNTASKCGLATQFKELQELQNTYGDKGFTVIGVSSQDFRNQEHSDTCKIKEVVQQKFNITFPLTTITKVTGKEAHSFYKWAGEQAGFLGTPKWNFHKYLIGKDGKLLNWYSSVTPPTSDKIAIAIEKELIR